MAGKQESVPALAGMSKNQIYEIMCQMKAMIEQNEEQARQILIQNPGLTRTLFQAQIILGMVQPQPVVPNIPSSASKPTAVPVQPSAVPTQQSNIQAPSSIPAQIVQDQTRKQQQNQPAMSGSSGSLPQPNLQPQAVPHSLQPGQLPKGHAGSQSTPVSLPQSSQLHNMNNLPHRSGLQPSSHLQPPMPSASSQLQQPLQNTGGQYMPLQPPLPPQPRPQMSGFPQHHPQMGPNVGFQHHAGPQLHHSQSMFHPGSKLPANLGPSFPHGQPLPPNQPPLQPVYQGGRSQMGAEFNQIGSSAQADRGSAWMPGPPENAAGNQLPGPPPFSGHMGPSNQPPRPSHLTPEMENTLLQQVMSLTPEQINVLPPEQRNQVIQLQQMLRHQKQ